MCRMTRARVPSIQASARHAQQSLKLAQHATELMVAAPQVVAHRLTRMAQAGHTPNARDRAEFQRMGAEKMAAFWESWQAMGLQAMMAWNLPWWQSGSAWTTLMARGLAPVHRRAVANAKRLGGTRKR